ncbi:MAG: methyltransferase domain-containing protein [Rhodocyclales bacterium]|nr:methyltransferase domain-containing protein [Rhodocyclales bacterium]
MSLRGLLHGVFSHFSDRPPPLAEVPSERPARLHIGGQQRTPGWKILDIQRRPEVDYVGDITDLSQFPAGAFDEIYASHVLEHVPQAKMDTTLQGLRRVLADGGRIMISVPDLDVLCGLFLDRKLPVAARFNVMRMMFGGQIDANDFHCIGLNLDILLEYLRLAGFSRVDCVQSFGIFNDTSNCVVEGIPVSLNLVVWK